MDHDQDGATPDRGLGSGPARSDAPRPAERLRARAAATDRAERFELRLAQVRRLQARRRRVRRMVRVAWVVAFAAIGALGPIVVAAALGAADPDGGSLLAWAAVGGAVGAVGPSVRGWLARRRGSRAWDAYDERYVLLGDPSAEVRDADRDAGREGERRAPPTRSGESR